MGFRENRFFDNLNKSFYRIIDDRLSIAGINGNLLNFLGLGLKGKRINSFIQCFSYEDWKSDRDEFGDDYGSCDAFGDPGNGFMRYLKAYGFDEDEGMLAEHFAGTEKVASVECWVFDSKGLNTIEKKYWVDPSNGCCLKVLDKEDGTYVAITEYNLNYTSWTDNLVPADYSGIE